MPKPNASADRSAAQTGRSRSRRRSTSGWRDRSSARTQAAARTTAAASSATVSGAVQPHIAALLIGTSRHTSQPASVSAPGTDTPPAGCLDDSGTSAIVLTSAATVTTSGSQKSQCQLRLVTIGPASNMPASPPTPSMADSSPTAAATRSAGSRSRRMPNAKGKTAPAAPCMARPMTRTASEPARAAITQPAASSARTAISTRLRPCWSPIRPAIGVAIAAAMR